MHPQLQVQGWRLELLLLGLLLVGVALFAVGYGVGLSDETFKTAWYSPLDGNGADSPAVGTVQGGSLDEDGNTPLFVSVRGLEALEEGQSYVLYVVRSKRTIRCGSFDVGPGTTRVKLSFPGLTREPRGWLIARENADARNIGPIVMRTK